MLPSTRGTHPTKSMETPCCASRHFGPSEFRNGSKGAGTVGADEWSAYTPTFSVIADMPASRPRATTRLMHRSKELNAWTGEPQQLPRQQPPLALEHFDEIVSHCPAMSGSSRAHPHGPRCALALMGHVRCRALVADMSQAFPASSRGDCRFIRSCVGKCGASAWQVKRLTI